jgi:hypothetical protein
MEQPAPWPRLNVRIAPALAADVDAAARTLGLTTAKLVRRAVRMLIAALPAITGVEDDGAEAPKRRHRRRDA